MIMDYKHEIKRENPDEATVEKGSFSYFQVVFKINDGYYTKVVKANSSEHAEFIVLAEVIGFLDHKTKPLFRGVRVVNEADLRKEDKERCQKKK